MIFHFSFIVILLPPNEEKKQKANLTKMKKKIKNIESNFSKALLQPGEEKKKI